jgi:hypothetical protein
MTCAGLLNTPAGDRVGNLGVSARSRAAVFDAKAAIMRGGSASG